MRNVWLGLVAVWSILWSYSLEECHVSWLFQSQPLKVWSNMLFSLQGLQCKSPKNTPLWRLAPNSKSMNFRFIIYRVTYNFSGSWISYLRQGFFSKLLSLHYFCECFSFYEAFQTFRTKAANIVILIIANFIPLAYNVPHKMYFKDVCENFLLINFFKYC